MTREASAARKPTGNTVPSVIGTSPKTSPGCRSPTTRSIPSTSLTASIRPSSRPKSARPPPSCTAYSPGTSRMSAAARESRSRSAASSSAKIVERGDLVGRHHGAAPVGRHDGAADPQRDGSVHSIARAAAQHTTTLLRGGAARDRLGAVVQYAIAGRRTATRARAERERAESEHVMMQVRVARPTRDLEAARSFYGALLGIPVLASFEDHDGYSGVVFGLPDSSRQLEVVYREGVTPSPTAEDQLVFYLGSADGLRALPPASMTPVSDSRSLRTRTGRVAVPSGSSTRTGTGSCSLPRLGRREAAGARAGVNRAPPLQDIGASVDSGQRQPA